MDIFGQHIHILNDEQNAIALQALKAAGHDLVTGTKSNTMSFIAKLEAEFPAVYADLKKGIADAKDNTLSGGDKAVKVATDVMASVPDVLAALPHLKDALVAAVTVMFSDEVALFKGVAVDTVEKA